MPDPQRPANRTTHPLVRIKKIYNEATVTPDPDQPLGAAAASSAEPIDALAPLLEIERVPVPSSDPDATKRNRLQVVYSFSANIVASARLRNGDDAPPAEENPDSEPNPWEAGWLLRCFGPDPTHPYDPSPTSDSNFRFYALCLKANGWEVSKRDPSYGGGRRFLKSDDAKDPREFPPHNAEQNRTTAVDPCSVLIEACREYPLGTAPARMENDVIPADGNSEAGDEARLAPARNVFRIFVESSLLTTVIDEEKPLPPHIPAFYAEDARVRFSSMRHATPERPRLRPSPADYDPPALHATGYPPQGVVWF